MSKSDPHIHSGRERPFGRSYKRFLLFRRIMIYFYAPLMTAGALWPCPHKYPWILPPVIVLVAVISLVLWKRGDDVGAVALPAATAAGMATWTLSHYLGLGVATALLTFVSSVLPAMIFVISSATLAGAADDPRFEDEY